MCSVDPVNREGKVEYRLDGDVVLSNEDHTLPALTPWEPRRRAELSTVVDTVVDTATVRGETMERHRSPELLSGATAEISRVRDQVSV